MEQLLADQKMISPRTKQMLLDLQAEGKKVVLAFGDGHNDRSIIEYAGIGGAMDNAVEDIKAIANEITLSNNHDGIATVLSRYLTICKKQAAT